MKIEEVARSGVESDRIERVLLSDHCWYWVKDNSFRIYSPVEPNARARSGQRQGAYLRFKADGEDGLWIEAPLSSLVAVGYSDLDNAGDESDGDKGK